MKHETQICISWCRVDAIWHSFSYFIGKNSGQLLSSPWITEATDHLRSRSKMGHVCLFSWCLNSAAVNPSERSGDSCTDGSKSPLCLSLHPIDADQTLIGLTRSDRCVEVQCDLPSSLHVCRRHRHDCVFDGLFVISRGAPESYCNKRCVYFHMSCLHASHAYAGCWVLSFFWPDCFYFLSFTLFVRLMLKG